MLLLMSFALEPFNNSRSQMTPIYFHSKANYLSQFHSRLWSSPWFSSANLAIFERYDQFCLKIESEIPFQHGITSSISF